MEGNPGYLRGRKLLWFEGGFRVPCIARWPGVIPSATQVAGMGVNFDLFPTCLNLIGVALPQDRIIDGEDMLPLLKGEGLPQHDPFYYFDTRKAIAIRHANWKYIRRYLTDIASFWPTQQGPFLFNLASDPQEAYNMIEAQPKLAEDLSGMLELFETEMEDNLRGWL
jgi:arylsulfatase A-like enzyme